MLALLTTGCTTGLVIDVGHLETTVLPVNILNYIASILKLDDVYLIILFYYFIFIFRHFQLAL